MVNLDEVLTFSEAAEKWGLADGQTIRKAVERKKFKIHEIKRSGNVWLTTYDAMRRVFGVPHAETTLILFDLYDCKRSQIKKELETFCQQAQIAIAKGDIVSVIKSKEHPEEIMCILKTQAELDGWKNRLAYFMQTALME